MASKKRTIKNTRVKVNQFNGKTIAKLDNRATNMVVFHFTDGTKAALEVECVLPSIGLYGFASVDPE
jgi:hypothetical protein